MWILMVMRVGGLATGMEIDSIVEQLMEAERLPLVRMQQDQTRLIWKQDALRDINRKLLELDQMILDMKLSPTYQSKRVHSSNENAVLATANTSAIDGSFYVKVDKLATNAINVGEALSFENFDPNMPLSELEGFMFDSTIRFSTYDENGEKQNHEIVVDPNDSLNQILKKISDDKNSPVRAFYDENSNRVILETTRTGQYNLDGGSEIEFGEDSFFAQLNLRPENEKGGENAIFIYNNELSIESKTNNYTLNGIHFEFLNETEENVRITVNTDVDHTIDSIKKFVEKYNEVIDMINQSQREEKYRDYPPLTEEQKSEMSEEQIKLWEEKAKSGILRGDPILSNSLFSLRQIWYSNVDTGGSFQSITQVGIRTTSQYMDGGKLEIDEEKLREALLEDPDSVRRLLTNSSEGNEQGLIQRLEEQLNNTMKRIEETAGKSTFTLDNYTIGRRMKDLNARIERFEARMVQIETRYWNQFTQMEKAIQRMNDQSMMLLSHFMNF